MKDIVNHQSCPRPTSKEPDIVFMTKPDRGGSKSVKSGANKGVYKRKAYSGNQMKTVLAKATVRENRNLSLGESGELPIHRRAEQLMTVGKSTMITTVKAESDKTEQWVGKVPEEVPFTVEGLLLAMVKGQCEPLYSLEGKHRANPRLLTEGLDLL